MPTTPYNFSTGEVITETRLDTHTTAIAELQAADVLQVARLDALEAENSVSTADIANEAVTRVKLAPAVITEIEGKTDLGHAHVMTDISDADWAATIHTHSTADLTDADYAATSHSHAIGDVSGVVPAAQGGAGTVTGILKADGLGTVTQASAGTDYLTPTGDGSGLTSLNGSNIASGTVADARLSSNVPLKNAANVFTGTQTANTTYASAVGGDTAAITGGITSTSSAAQTYQLRGLLGQATLNGSGLGSSIAGVVSDLRLLAAATSGVTSAYGFYTTGIYRQTGAGTIANFYGLYLGANVGALGATNSWGVYSLLPKNYFAGLVGIGTTSPTYSLHVAPTAGATAGQTLFVQDATATTGKTRAVFKAGAGDTAADPILQIQNNAGTVILSFMNEIREAADDTAAAALTPAVPVGGVYRTGSVLKIRIA